MFNKECRWTGKTRCKGARRTFLYCYKCNDNSFRIDRKQSAEMTCYGYGVCDSCSNSNSRGFCSEKWVLEHIKEGTYECSKFKKFEKVKLTVVKKGDR